MNGPDLISEDEASKISGVSAVTLKRFADAGYLRVDDAGGLHRFSRSEIEKVFGLAPVPFAESDESEAEKVTEFTLKGHSVRESFEPPSWSAPRHSQQPDQLKQAQQPEQPSPSPPAPTEKPAAPDPALQREIGRLSSIVQLQEKYIELKEQEIQGLREDRNWLRSRIEKLEEKSDRDQLILVSIAETNRGLVKALENKKSTVRAALEWFGLLPPPSTQSGQ